MVLSHSSLSCYPDIPCLLPPNQLEPYLEIVSLEILRSHIFNFSQNTPFSFGYKNHWFYLSRLLDLVPAFPCPCFDCFISINRIFTGCKSKRIFLVHFWIFAYTKRQAYYGPFTSILPSFLPSACLFFQTIQRIRNKSKDMIAGAHCFNLIPKWSLLASKVSLVLSLRAQVPNFLLL